VIRLSEYLRKALEEDRANTIAAEVISEILTLPKVVDAVLASIPTDWRYSEFESGDRPSKQDFAFEFLWEYIQEEHEGEVGAS